MRTSVYMDTDRPAGGTNPHIGVDYRAAVGTSFYSLGDGKVSDIGKTSKGAKYITIEYANGDKVRFLHIDGVADGLKVGSSVSEGQILGKSGNTGTKYAHLHVDATNKNGDQIDPEGMNYGRFTNEEVFNKYGGDYTQLPSAKASSSEESGDDKSNRGEAKVTTSKNKITVSNVSNNSWWTDFKNKAVAGYESLEKWLRTGAPGHN